MLKTRAVQTLRDCRASSNCAERLDCGAFTAAFLAVRDTQGFEPELCLESGCVNLGLHLGVVPSAQKIDHQGDQRAQAQGKEYGVAKRAHVLSLAARLVPRKMKVKVSDVHVRMVSTAT